MKFTTLFLVQFSLLSIASQACDICGCYTGPTGNKTSLDDGFQATMAEQFTHFGSIRVDGHEVNDPSGQYLDSSITQFIIGHTFLGKSLDLQTNIPYIYRNYLRPEGFVNEHGTESGLGDISFLARYRVWEKETNPTLRSSLHLMSGLKFPTGDSSRIKEEFSETEIEGAPESGIHGHDLTLGTGSYDAIFGGEFYTRTGSFFFEAAAQFTLRGDGRYSYHFANDLSWNTGTGWTFYEEQDRSLSLKVVVSGEYKDTDRFQGRAAEDTGMKAVYLGPEITTHWGTWSAEVGVDLPVVIDNTALQAVADYRIRAAFTWQF